MRIKKFNEELNEEFDSDYVKTCFADLIDAGAQVEERESTGIFSSSLGKWIQIKIDIKKIERLGEFGAHTPEFISRRNKLVDYINNFDFNNKIFQKVKISMNLLSDEYPNYKVYSRQLTDTIFEISIYPEKQQYITR